MKRGFLRGSKNDSKNSRPPASKQGVDASQVAANPADKPQESFKIPLIPDYDDVPDKRRTFAGNIVTIPLPTPLPSSGTEPHTLALIYPGAKEAIEAIPGFPTPYKPFLREHYCIDDAPGAGKGMFALTDLDLGDLILRERPLCLFPRWFAHDNKDAEEFAMATLSLLKPEDNEAFFNLANSRPRENVPAGIVHTNSIDASRMPGDYNGNYASICRDLCRVNHRSVLQQPHTASLTIIIAAFRMQRIDGNSKTWHMNFALYVLSRRENKFSSRTLIIFPPAQLGKNSYGPCIFLHADARVAPFLPQKYPPAIIADKYYL